MVFDNLMSLRNLLLSYKNFLQCSFWILYFSVDHTRIVLRDGDPQVIGSDYINGNLISVSKYINLI